jgi:hypothetical protein
MGKQVGNGQTLYEPMIFNEPAYFGTLRLILRALGPTKLLPIVW